ncbi:MAG: glycosyltransferase [Bacteroidetes bacterium]|nr:glycosyltransferase [Bacteroidota bacterium]MCW5896250.1 glycosyltransferase [Bacteroidota bacterium]
MTSRITVAYIHYPSDLYGAGRSLIRLLEHIDRTRFRPLVVLKRDGPLRARLEESGVRVSILKSLSVIERSRARLPGLATLPMTFLASVVQLFIFLKRENVYLVHTNTGIIPSSAFAAKIAGVPHVWHIRDWFGEFSRLWQVYSRYILWSSACVLCVSQSVARQFPASSKVRVMHNGFSLDEFRIDRELARRDTRARYNINETFVVGTVGRIKFVRKGQEVLVRAISVLKEKGAKVKCLIVGSVFPGNEVHLTMLQELINSLGLQEEVVLAGELSDPRPAFAAMDVFVLPSAQPEPFGGVVVEAMAMGLPVVGTSIGGTVDQVVEGVTGFLIPPADHQALAEKLYILYKDRSLGRQFGEAGRKRMRSEFDLHRTVKAIEDIYTKIGRPGT